MTIVFTKRKKAFNAKGIPVIRTEVHEFSFGSTKRQQYEKMAIARHYNKRAQDEQRYVDTVQHYTPFNDNPGEYGMTD